LSFLALLLAAAVFQGEWSAAREKLRLCLDKDGEEALAACREAREKGLTPFHAAIAQDAVSRKLLAMSRLKEAESALEELVRLRPKESEASLRLGELRLYGLGRAEDSLSPLEEAIRLKPDDPGAHASLGVALAQLGRAGLAAEAIREALRIDPGFLDTHPAVRRVLEAAGRGEGWPGGLGDAKH
jgi:tetratricopeptide (TPR) repeat protein